MGLFETLLCLKALIVMSGIGILRKFIRPFYGRTETVWAKEQYDALNYVLTYFGVDDIGFTNTMNLGCNDKIYEGKEYNEMLEDQHPATKLQLQLYHRVCTGAEHKLDMTGKDVLEVGCGRGGGTSFLANKLGPKMLTGIDLSPEGIEYCNTNFKKDNISFSVGDAQAMPLKSDTYDMVLNVESSHCYPKVMEFLKESKRVLKKGGYFCYCDISTPAAVAQLRGGLPMLGLKVIDEEDLTPKVLSALEKVAGLRSKALEKVPFFIRPSLMNVIGQPGSITHTNIASGDWCYIRFLCQKQ